jgi:acyl-homoserine lactone synthase
VVPGVNALIHVVTAENRHLYEDALEESFRIRHDIFVGERGWTALDRPDGREIDAYDAPATIYFLAMENGRVLGGHRLFPTTRPYMISEVFYGLVQREMPSAPDILEWSRFFVIKDWRAGPTYLQLMAAVQELCLEESVSEIVAVIEMWWLPRFQEAGFKVRPLGLPQVIEGTSTAAVSITISADSLSTVRALGNLPRSVLVRRDLTSPLIDRVIHAATP